MDILAVKFNGIDATRTENLTVREVDANLNISHFEPKKNRTAFVRFAYMLTFKPDVGHLILNGYVVVRDTQKELKRITNYWKKNKRLPQDVEAPLTNMISASATISSVFAGHVVDLMPPFIPPVLAPR